MRDFWGSLVTFSECFTERAFKCVKNIIKQLVQTEKKKIHSNSQIFILDQVLIVERYSDSATSTSIPPGKAPLSQRTVSSLAGPAPPPGTWRPVRLQPAGRGRSCRRPTTSR